MKSITNRFHFSKDVKAALELGEPVLALESTIIAHGMPYPDNLEFARNAEDVALKQGVVPATIAILDGIVHIGLVKSSLETLAKGKVIEKVAVRDISRVLSQKRSGATTVSATMKLAHLSGIPVFATGGIGGVHRGAETTLDVSQDIKELSRTPVIVISAGAKAILDIPKTLEVLETKAVPVLGYQTDNFPAFYSRTSGAAVSARVDSPTEIARLYQSHVELGLCSGILIANPIPEKAEIPKIKMDSYIETTLDECSSKNISGKAVTPFLLKRIVELTGGRSLEANIALALNNVKLGAEIAVFCRKLKAES